MGCVKIRTHTSTCCKSETKWLDNVDARFKMYSSGSICSHTIAVALKSESNNNNQKWSVEQVLKGRKRPRPLCQSSTYARVSGLKAIKVSGSIVVKKQYFFYFVNVLQINHSVITWSSHVKSCVLTPQMSRGYV
jgi:hypothetical protein